MRNKKKRIDDLELGLKNMEYHWSSLFKDQEALAAGFKQQITNTYIDKFLDKMTQIWTNKIIDLEIKLKRIGDLLRK